MYGTVTLSFYQCELYLYMKILHMEYGGLVIYHMRAGTWALPSAGHKYGEGRIKAIETFWNDLVMMVQRNGRQQGQAL